jgi:hypothetical protein
MPERRRFGLKVIYLIGSDAPEVETGGYRALRKPISNEQPCWLGSEVRLALAAPSKGGS